MTNFIPGLTTMGFAVSGLFFLRFWSQTKDVLFVFFAIAFWLFAINYGVDALLNSPSESVALYLLRLLGFGLIIGGILSKNSRKGQH